MLDQISSFKIHDQYLLSYIQVTSPHDDDDDENDENDENDDTGGKMVPRLDTGSNTEAELLREELKEALRSRKHTK